MKADTRTDSKEIIRQTTKSTQGIYTLRYARIADDVTSHVCAHLYDWQMFVALLHSSA